VPEAKVRIVTLGCAKNDVDSEEIAGVLQASGYSVDGTSATTDAIVINTCGFLEASKQESIQAILDAVAEKNAGRASKVIVAGCLAQRLGPELMRLAPGADAYVGVGQMGRFDEIVRDTLTRSEPTIDVAAPHHRWADIPTRARSGQPWSAYLKVSEGCDHKCTFCTIPSFRGKHESKPIERVLAEANHLARQGTREINLIAQDVTQYGYDLYKEFTLPRLLRDLNSIEALDWIRILYFYPNRLTDEVIEAMATLPKVAKYIDIPLQHAHPDTLRRMKRPWDGERYLKIIEKVRAAMPDVAIRTTFIVGFPGETDADFEQTLQVVEQARFASAYTFQYSPRPGTPAATMAEQVDKQVVQERYQRLVARINDIAWQENQGQVGRAVEVLVLPGEGRKDSATTRISGRARDHRLVHVGGGVQAEPGDVVEATVTYAAPHHLIADEVRSVRRRPAPPRHDHGVASPGVASVGAAVSLPMPTLRSVGAAS